MSGPKVIRIVTREELIEICEGWLARLDAVIAEWTRIGHRNETVTAADVAAVVARREDIARLLQRGNFAAIQKQVPEEIAYLRVDTQARLERAAQAAAEARKAGRRAAHAATTVLAALSRSGQDIPPELRQALGNPGNGGPAVEAAISKALSRLTPREDAREITAAQRGLAASLSAGEQRLTLTDWMARQPPIDDATTRQIDRHIAELESLDGAEAAAAFVTRAAALAAESSNRYRLLADSLLLDLAQAAKQRKERLAVLSDLAEVAAQLRRYQSLTAQTLLAEIDAVLEAGDAARASQLGGRAQAVITAEVGAIAAQARRNALLAGLASLGYEVTEGMSTAWVTDGRVVLRKASAPDYGVELAGGVEAERLQARVVGFGTAGTGRDRIRDRDMETIWCGDVDRLSAMLATQGAGLVIEKARPAGEVPLKMVEGTGTTAAHQAEIATLRTRQLDR